MKAVQFDKYGGLDVLRITEVPIPEAAQGEVQIKVKAAGINPADWKIREGMWQSFMPITFPSGEGTEFAGVITKLGSGVRTLEVGQEVIGFSSKRGSQAEYVVAPAQNLTQKPQQVPWEVAGALPVVGTTAYACVRAVGVKAGDTVAVSAAAGGVGSTAVQLARKAGAKVIGIASPANHGWLRSRGVIPISYGDDLQARLRDYHPNAFIDTHGGGYVKLAIDLGVARERINTIADFAAVEQYGVKGEGSDAARNASVLAELASLVAAGDLEVSIAGTFRLEQVRAAFEQLQSGHTRGKIVLLP